MHQHSVLSCLDCFDRSRNYEPLCGKGTTASTTSEARAAVFLSKRLLHPPDQKWELEQQTRLLGKQNFPSVNVQASENELPANGTKHGQRAQQRELKQGGRVFERNGEEPRGSRRFTKGTRREGRRLDHFTLQLRGMTRKGFGSFSGAGRRCQFKSKARKSGPQSATPPSSGQLKGSGGRAKADSTMKAVDRANNSGSLEPKRPHADLKWNPLKTQVKTPSVLPTACAAALPHMLFFLGLRVQLTNYGSLPAQACRYYILEVGRRWAQVASSLLAPFF